MGVLVPDIIICNTINNALNVVRTDYLNRVAAQQEERSILYQLFYGQTIGTYDMYANIKQLVITDNESPKFLEAKLSYDHNSTSVSPAIYVTLAAESASNNVLSIGEGDQDEVDFTNTPPMQDEYFKVFRRRYATTYNIVVISENKNEGAVLYNLIKELMVTCITHFEMEGLSNMKIGGQDIRINNAVLDRLFQRSVTLNFEYEQTVPELVVHSVFTKLRLFWQPEGADVPVGGIDIDQS